MIESPHVGFIRSRFDRVEEFVELRDDTRDGRG